MSAKTSSSFVLILYHCLVTLATANRAARSGGNKPPEFAQPRSDKYDPPLLLHHPYGPSLSFAEFGDLVRDSLMITPAPPTLPQDPEADQASTRAPIHSFRRRLRDWWGFIFRLIRLIFSLLQMRLPSIYFLRVAAIIRESDISMADFASLHQPTTRGILEAITVTAGVGVPNIHEIHSMKRFKRKWRAFVKQCMGEWRNLNLVSTLLMR